MKNRIIAIITDIVKEKYGIDVPDFAVDRSPADKAGDYAVNICFLLSKELKKAPFMIGEELAAEIGKNEIVSEIEVAKPGYINITIDNKAYHDEAKEILSNKKYFNNTSGNGKRINLEFVSANPVGPLNIVSGRAAAYGDTLANILIMSGYEVVKEDYVNDFGRQMDMFGVSVKERYKELHGGEANIPEDGYNGAYVADVAKQFDLQNKDYKFNESEFDIKNNDFRKFGRDMMVSSQIETMGKFGVRFDEWFSETRLHTEGTVEKAMKRLEDNNMLFEEDGATWFNTQQFGDDKNRVVKKQDGSLTYFASDIGYMVNKLEERKFDIIINILGPDHHGYIKRLESIIEGLGEDKERLKVLILQQVNLLEKGEKVKMSKRAGKIVTLDELIDEVGKDAARYFFVMRNFNTHLDFDIALAKEKSNENPVFYVQYAYARICSIFAKAKDEGVDTGTECSFDVLEKEEKDILLEMIGIKQVIEDAALKYSTSSLVAAIYDLVSRFHSFYNKHKVISDDKEATAKRMFILKALQQTLGTCFDIIGIEKLERM